MRSFKRLLSLFLVALLLMATLLPALPAHAAETVSIQNGSGTRSPVRVGKTLSYRAIVNGSFDGFAFCMPTWTRPDSVCTLSLYKWEGTYDRTVAGTPIATKVFDPMTDGAKHWVDFDAQPAGEYLFHVSDPKGEVGVWTNTSPSDSKGFFYENGMEGRGEPELFVRFTESVADPFGTCEPSGDIRVTQMATTGGEGEGVTNISSAIGLRLNTAAPFVGAEFKMATYMNSNYKITISVYEWKGSYAATVEAAPKASEEFVMVDNAFQGITFDELPAGDYLILAHNPQGGPAMYHFSRVTAFEGVVYQDGYPMEEAMTSYPECRLTFTEDLKDQPYFLPCEKSDDTVTGDHVAPPEYVLPADSLINTHKVMPDTWVFTDGLGRVSLTNAEVGNVREDKTLAMFYWTWHIDGFASDVPNNLQKLSEEYPEAMNDWDHELWARSSGVHFWNEPIYGYYRADDPWVARRQAELLANAGVDVVFTDNTNSTLTWRNAYSAVLDAWSDAMDDGVRTPKFSFMLPFSAHDDSKQQLQSIYLDVFRSNKWQNLWYYRDGKPMLMAHTGNLSATASATEKEILSFFTFRANYPGYSNPSPAIGSWGWLSLYPQAVYYGDRDDYKEKNPEQITVGIAMNHNYVKNALDAMNGENIMGRSYTSKGYVTDANAKLWGHNFAEQFEYALEVDPQVVFVTGWNEWRVGRYESWGCGTENAFPDTFNDEYSRDIEPSKGDLKDHYYYQLVNFVRQYKGANPIPAPSVNVTIDMKGGAQQWEAVEPYYAAYIGNTEDRDAQGYGDLVYTETSGRNDIIGAQIARDDEFVYFHVECAENITPYTDKLWMNLYIDAAGDGALDGWNSFDYVVNKTAPTATTATLEKFTGNGYASEKVADVEYTLDGRYMTVKIAKSDLGLTGDDYTINFAWTDNVHDEGNYDAYSGDIMDFYISGDVAPGGRFKYSFISTADNAGKVTETEPATTPATEPATDPATVAPTETATDAPAESGCKSTLALASVALLAAAAVVLRKKED